MARNTEYGKGKNERLCLKAAKLILQVSLKQTNKLYLFEILDKLSCFNATHHIEADVHFHFSVGVRQFDDGNLKMHV